jgi:preprotein translocase subunit SecA
VLNAKQHEREATVITEAGLKGKVTIATNMAGRGTDIQLGPGVADLGGLDVLGTERHESRRIDNQLRGRSGRQGDPGESLFYLSLEDDLMRIFATGAMSWVMDRALDEDVPIESKMVTKSVERAQNTVEQRNAEIRKNVLKYDEVLNQQRMVIYRRRQQILEQGDLKETTIESIGDVAESLVATHCLQELDDTWDLDGLLTELGSFWSTALTVEQLRELDKTSALRELITEDGVARYEAREAELGEPIMRQIERQIMLQLIDQRWREHLTEMDYLRQGINLRAMGQRDPLTEWQREGFELFSAMMSALAVDFVRYVMHVEVASTTEGQQPVDQKTSGPGASGTSGNGAGERGAATATKAAPRAMPKTLQGPVVRAADITASQGSPEDTKRERSTTAGRPSPQPLVKDDWDRTPRNAPCPCGSGRKFKQCHG